jgi:arylsulfatase A-like enzyme
VIISIDALNRSALDIYNPQAPNLSTLDAFANQSAVFTRAYTSASWTLPAHASLLTGLYPDRHGAAHEKMTISDRVTTLAEVFKKSGFDTAGFTAGGFVSWYYGFNKGFDRYDGWKNPSATSQEPAYPRNGRRSDVAGVSLFDRGIAFINSRKKGDKRFFLFLHTFVVHDYVQMHPWAVDRLPPYPDKSLAEYLACLTGKASCPREDWDRLKSLYDAELYRMDDGLDRVLTALDKQGLRQSTLIIFLSDHGEGFDPDRGRIHHGGREHEDQIRIPLIISGPDINHRVCGTPISIVDIMPTVLDICNISTPRGLDGISLAKVLRGEKDIRSHNTIYAMEHHYWWDEEGRHILSVKLVGRPLTLAVIRGDDWFIQDRKGMELYNMINDPLQTSNLAAGSPLISEFIRLAKMRDAYTPPVSTNVKLGKEVVKQLRTLGYIE